MATIPGTTGNDTLTGDEEADFITGDAGNDSLSGAGGNDTIAGGDDNDTVLGDAGDDNLAGDSGEDSVFGGDGNDTLFGGEGNDTLSGDEGDDWLIGDDGDDSLHGGNGNDIVQGYAGHDTLIGGAGIDNLTGFTGNDLLLGGDDNDTLAGSEGNDTLDGGDGWDYLAGGPNDDILIAGAGRDTLFGDGGGLMAGNDTLSGGEGPDFLDGQAGEDELFGGADNDTLLGSEDNDFLDGNEGDDSLSGDEGHDILRGSAGSDTLLGFSGVDTLIGGDGDDSLSGGDDDDHIRGNAGADELFGGLGNDTLLGFADNDSLFGNEDNDLLRGGRGDDELFGMDGDDTLVGERGFDLLDGGPGNDTFILRGREFRIFDTEGANSIHVEEDFVKVPFAIDPTPTFGNGVMALPYWLDSLLGDNANSFNNLLGGDTTIFFGFPAAAPGYLTDPKDTNGWMAFNEDQKIFTRGVLADLSTFTNLTFVETSTFDAPNVMSFANNTQVGTAGYAYFPNTTSLGSDVFINKDTAGNLAPMDGEAAALTWIHEILHALGLKHPFEDGPTLPDDDGDPSKDEDSTAWTVMSYDSFPADYHAVPQPLDVAAIHYLYGPSPTARVGDDTYVISETETNFIWDGAGTDIVWAFDATQPVTIHLEPGYQGFVGAAADPLITAPGQVTVNFGTVIEWLVGSAFDDTLGGNAAGNYIEGNDGMDTIFGRDGDDTLFGGDMDDSLVGGNGLDTAFFTHAPGEYTLTYTGTGYTVTDNLLQSGTDTLTGIEFVQFGLNTTVVLGVALGGLDGQNGFRLDGEAFNDLAGHSVSSAGDVNGDGFDDVIIGANSADLGQGDAGSSYVVFGKPGLFSPSIGLDSLDGSNGFRLEGVAPNDSSGWSVSSAGDVNGDGFDDLIIGAFWSVPHDDLSGSSYVVFGKHDGFAATMSLASLNGTDGFRLDGSAENEFSGHVVSSAGDINGDGFDDLIVGAYRTDPNGSESGASYVVFGKKGGFSATLSLVSLDGTNGFQLNGAAAGDNAGFSVSNAGDFNGDGYDDLIIGAPKADFNQFDSGTSYLVFGKADGFSASMELASLDGTNGMRIDGVSFQTNSGWSVSSAGDVNGDGFDDVIIGAYNADPFSYVEPPEKQINAGSSYVVFGKPGGATASMDLADLDGTNGFRLDGVSSQDWSGYSVSGAGDVNGDGYDDLIVGAYRADPLGEDAGSSYVVFGKASGFDAMIDLDSLDHSNGFRLDGAASLDGAGFSVSGAGDVNGDGVDDLIIGGSFADNNGLLNSGSGYVIFGQQAPLGNREPAGEVTISGDAEEDQTLTVTNTLIDPDGIGEISYQWNVDGAPIDGAMSDSYTPGQDDVGKIITVTASYTDQGGTEESVTSDPVGPVANVNDLPTGDIVITGNPVVENTLTVSDTLQDEDGLGAITYQWNADGIPIIGATGTEYFISAEKAGKVITVTASYTDGFGTAESVTGGATIPVIPLAGVVNLPDLDGSNGFRLDGVNSIDRSGWWVSGAGDINGDGFDDLLVGAWRTDFNGSDSGSAYLVFGKADGFSATSSLGDLDGSDGFRLDGLAAGDRVGWSVSDAGDINGDGFDDLFIGSQSVDPGGRDGAGSGYLVFGKASGFAASFDLASLDGSNGFRLDGSAAGDEAGGSVSSAGDVNGDGIDDLIIGARFADNSAVSAGSAYVVFGKAAGFAATIDLGSIDGANGFRLDGAAAQDQFGLSVSAAGDVNGDGIDDVVVGAYAADNQGGFSGSAYVVFGKTDGFAASLDVSLLDGSNGFRLDGEQGGDYAGYVVSDAGDVNGDGIDDLIVGAYNTDYSGEDSGSSYVIFGTTAGFAAVINLGDLDGTNGFRLDGVDEDNESGQTVSGAGDVNGDGIDDLLVGAWRASSNGNLSGSAYVVYGTSDGFPAVFELAGLDGFSGFRLDGEMAGDIFGYSVSAAGDVNNDGAGDFIIGAPSADFGAGTSGSSYVLFGVASGPGGLLVEGGAGDDTLVGGNGDDTLLGFGGRDTLEGLAGDDQLDGGDDIDTVLFQGELMDYSIVNSAGVLTVTGPASDGEDTLTGAERLDFIDGCLAFDLDGNAGSTAKLLGVLTGSVDPGLMGIGLDIFDNTGLTFDEVMGLGLDAVLGKERTNSEVVNQIYLNLIGQAPSAGELNALTAEFLDSGAYTQVGLAVLAADHPFNIELIGLPDLLANGVEYIPVT